MLRWTVGAGAQGEAELQSPATELQALLASTTALPLRCTDGAVAYLAALRPLVLEEARASLSAELRRPRRPLALRLKAPPGPGRPGLLTFGLPAGAGTAAVREGSFGLLLPQALPGGAGAAAAVLSAAQLRGASVAVVAERKAVTLTVEVGRWGRAPPPPRWATTFVLLGALPAHERMHTALADADGALAGCPLLAHIAAPALQAAAASSGGGLQGEVGGPPSARCGSRE